MGQLASMIVEHSCVPTRHVLVSPTGRSAHGYHLFFCIPRLHDGSQEQVHCSVRSGLWLQTRFLTSTPKSKSHRSHRIRRKR